MLSYWLIALLSCTQHQARGKSPDEGKCEESQERKTALVTGAAGFIGHHVIEVRESISEVLMRTGFYISGIAGQYRLEHCQPGQVGLLWESQQDPGHAKGQERGGQEESQINIL